MVLQAGRRGVMEKKIAVGQSHLAVCKQPGAWDQPTSTSFLWGGGICDRTASPTWCSTAAEYIHTVPQDANGPRLLVSTRSQQPRTIRARKKPTSGTRPRNTRNRQPGPPTHGRGHSRCQQPEPLRIRDKNYLYKRKKHHVQN